jgi:hypothetical protein
VKHDVHLNVLRAEQAGLVRAYFPNGNAFDCFYATCETCVHYTDDMDNPKPGRLAPPFNACKWGVLDRILYYMAVPKYGYGTTYHPPEDMGLYDGHFPECKRYWPKGDNDDNANHPPPPDCPGQMFLGDVMEVEIRKQEARA